MSNLDVVKILNLGVIGLGFLLALLAYFLLRQDQTSPDLKRPAPWPVYIFMIFSIVLCGFGFVSQNSDARRTLRQQYEKSLEDTRAQDEEKLARTRASYEEILHSRRDLHKVVGKITGPLDGGAVGKKIPCAGSVSNLKRGMHLWLAVEVNGFIWPKEAELNVGPDGRWTATVYQDSATSSFSLDLLVADEDANGRIGDWIERGKREGGRFEKMDWFEGTVRLDRIDGLRLKDRP